MLQLSERMKFRNCPATPGSGGMDKSDLAGFDTEYQVSSQKPGQIRLIHGTPGLASGQLPIMLEDLCAVVASGPYGTSRMPPRAGQGMNDVKDETER